MADMITTQSKVNPMPDDRPTVGIRLILCCLAITTAVLFAASSVFAEGAGFDNDDNDDGSMLAEEFRHGLACTATARAARLACRSDVWNDFWTTIGNCANLSDPVAAQACSDEAKQARYEDGALCGDRFGARIDLCLALGEDTFEPAFEPADFVDPLEIGVSVAANPYFPLQQGQRWVYEGGDEIIVVTVTDRTKQIGGVTCLVLNDRVEEAGAVVEDTDDWYAQDRLGNVWYCGEIAQNFEIPEGEDTAELVDLDGSWRAFRDFAQPGIVMQAMPQMGQIYRQEFALREAEDAAQIVLLDASATVPATSCTGDCLVTREFTPIEPEAEEYKYYAPGVGLILEVGQDGSRVELVEFTR